MPTYQIDSQHTGAHFKVRHMMISNVKGEFGHTTGEVDFDPAELSSARIDVTIDTDTISTREPQRDKHLKSRDFLDVSRYPKITFRSTRVAAAGQNAYDVTGELTIRDVTRTVVLHVNAITPEIKDPYGFLRRGASARTRVERKDFGLTWNVVLESGGFVVGEDVDIAIDVELMRKAA